MLGKHRSETTKEKLKSANLGKRKEGITEEMRRERLSMRRGANDEQLLKWRLDVFKRDGFACRVCGKNTGRDLNAHHKNQWAKFVDERYIMDNGVTLCSRCHRKYHSIYGVVGNMATQFSQWLEATS